MRTEVDGERPSMIRPIEDALVLDQGNGANETTTFRISGSRRTLAGVLAVPGEGQAQVGRRVENLLEVRPATSTLTKGT